MSCIVIADRKQYVKEDGGIIMKKKYLLLVGILAVCFVMGGCKKKSEADKVTAEKEPTIITKDDSVSGQVVEMEQGSRPAVI